jgi:hypothetical protein
VPSYFPIQPAFNSGEWTGRMHGRVDLPGYARALSRCENWEPFAQGSLRMRCGTEDIAALNDPRDRLIRFRTVNGQDYVLVLRDRKLNIYLITGAGAVAQPAEPENQLIVNGDFAIENGSSWATTGSVVFTGGVAGNATLHTSFVIGPATIAQPVYLPHVSDIRVRVSVGGLTAEVGDFVSVRVGTTPGGLDIVNHTITDSGAVDVTALAAPAGDLYLTIIGSSGGDARAITIDDVLFEIEGVLPPPSADVPTPWIADIVKEVQYDCETGADRVVFVHATKRPWYLKNVNGTWTFGTVPFLDIPEGWGGDNWPATIQFDDGRAYYAGEPAKRNRILVSAAGALENFKLASGSGGAVLPSDALDVKAATKGAFRWLCGGRAMLAGTDLSEQSIFGSGGPVMAGDLQVRNEVAFGSAAIQPVAIGQHVLYVTANRKQVRALGYDFASEGWGSEDVSFVFEHILAEGVKELHVALTPSPLIIAVLDSGKLAACTFNPTEKVLAWWRVTFPGGLVRSAAVSQGDAGPYLWLAMQRGAAMRLERLPLAENAGSSYLDAAVSGFAGVGVNGIGIIVPVHLRGKTIRVLVDGALMGTWENAPASIDVSDDLGLLNHPYVVGLPYAATGKTLPPEGGNPGGSAQGMKVHRTEIVARLNNSARPKLNGKRAGEGRPFSTAADTVEALVSGDYGVTHVDSDSGAVTIEQDLPFRTEVCALFGKTHLSKG